MTDLTSNVKEREAVKLLQDIIRIPSITGEERECAEYLCDFFKENGFKVLFDPIDDHRANVIASLQGDDPDKGLIFNGHIDVVPPGNVDNWRYPPFGGEIHDDRLYGRGSTDMKGGVTAMIMAGLDLLRSDDPLIGDLQIQCVVDEEKGSKFGTKRLVEKGWVKGSAAIVTESSNLSVVIASKGDIGLEITIEGKTAHASRPWVGINAIHKMFELIQRFLELPKIQDWNTQRKHEILGSPTIGVSVIEGGIQRNMIPDRCMIVLDRRIVPRLETTQQAYQEMIDLIKMAKVEDPELNVSTTTILQEDAVEVSRDISIVKQLSAVHELVLGSQADIIGTHGFTDARIFVNQCRIPSVVYGPGSLKLAHADNEFLHLGQLYDSTKVLALLAKKLLADSS